MKKSIMAWAVVALCFFLFIGGLGSGLSPKGPSSASVFLVGMSFIIGLIALGLALHYGKEEGIKRRAYLEEKGREEARKEKI